ncbi:HIT family protein [Patescibacteria group bacterium]|nr:HIT family protein [Patescibacteria group bacterium]
MDCIFCKIINGQEPAYKVYENERFLAFLDTKPVNPGHLLIVPKNHVGYIFDLDNGDYQEIFSVAKYLSGPLQKATQAKRIGIAIEGFGIDHIHLHLVPVNHAGELDPNRAKSLGSDELTNTATQIRKCIG